MKLSNRKTLMLISDGTTFDKNSEVKNVTGFIWNWGNFAINEMEWIRLGQPSGMGLFQGTKNGVPYEDTCLTEEFTYKDELETKDGDIMPRLNGEYCGCSQAIWTIEKLPSGGYRFLDDKGEVTGSFVDADTMATNFVEALQNLHRATEVTMRRIDCLTGAVSPWNGEPGDGFES